jgi:hypothetical protein
MLNIQIGTVGSNRTDTYNSIDDLYGVVKYDQPTTFTDSAVSISDAILDDNTTDSANNVDNLIDYIKVYKDQNLCSSDTQLIPDKYMLLLFNKGFTVNNTDYNGSNIDMNSTISQQWKNCQ